MTPQQKQYRDNLVQQLRLAADIIEGDLPYEAKRDNGEWKEVTGEWAKWDVAHPADLVTRRGIRWDPWEIRLKQT